MESAIMEEQIASGQSFEKLASQWASAQPVVSAFIRGMVRNHHDAEDVLQRTAATAVRKYADYDAQRPFASWAVGLARIEVLRYRQETRRNRVEFNDAVIGQMASVFEDNPQRLIEMKLALEKCLSRLKGRVREVFWLTHGEGLSVDTLAGRLDTTTNAVVVALHRGRTLLHRCVQQQLGLFGGKP